MAKFKHVFGINGQFVLLENRHYWLALNDADWHHAAPWDADFTLQHEAYYPTGAPAVDFELPDNVRLFSEEALRLEQKKLETLALAELAKNLKAAQAEEDLNKLIEKIDFHLKQERDLYE